MSFTDKQWLEDFLCSAPCEFCGEDAEGHTVETDGFGNRFIRCLYGTGNVYHSITGTVTGNVIQTGNVHGGITFGKD